MKALVTYGADVNAVNNLKESPRHLVAKDIHLRLAYCMHCTLWASRCSTSREEKECSDGCKIDEK